MGLVINFNREEMVEAVTRLLTDDNFYELCRKNALDYAKELDWRAIFDNALKETAQIGLSSKGLVRLGQNVLNETFYRLAISPGLEGKRENLVVYSTGL